MGLKDIDWDYFNNILESGTKEEFQEMLLRYDLSIKDGKIIPNDKSEVNKLIEYWDKSQHIRKINLNALYGSLLQASCRFFDKRLGQSTTLTGRQIVKHMTAETNKIIDGEYNYLGKSVIYNDTDSVYFSAYPTLKDDIDSGNIEWTRDSVVELYDKIGDMVNDSFPDFMEEAFHCPKNRGSVIKSGREIVGETALFITKKRYAVLYYDKEGKRADKDGKPGKIKAMGLDLKRADTPEYMQDFLSEILEDVLTDVEHAIIVDKIKSFRGDFKKRPGWEKGTPKRVNNIGKFLGKEQELIDQEKTGKVNIPGHVRAAINWNLLKRMYNDNYAMNIVDGFKVIVCKLKDNPLGFTSVAYPIDELRLPEWYKELPFDHDAMEETIIDKKIDNLIGVLNFDISSTIETNTFNNLFDFDE